MEPTTRADAIAREQALAFDIKAKAWAMKHADAVERAWRTFKQQILIDAAAATGTGVLVLMQTVDPTNPAFWPAVGLLATRSFVAAGASYLHRLVKEPKASAATPAEPVG